MTRIAVFLSTSGHSGVDRAARHLIPALARRGYRVDLLKVRHHGPDLDLGEAPPGVRVIDLGSRHTYACLPALVRYLLREQPAVMLSDKDRVNRTALLARGLARVWGRVQTRLVLSSGTTISIDLATRGPLERWVQRNSMGRLYPLADQVIVTSAGVADDMAAYTGLPRRLIRVVPSPVVPATLFEAELPRPDHPWFADPERPLILSAGELCGRKGFDTLLRAFALVRARRPCRLMILGRGSAGDRLLALAGELRVAEDFALPGFVPQPYAWMAHADLFAFSSRWEGLGFVLIEALAVGTPVVAADCPSGPAEILQGGRYGPLVPVDDHEAMARAMLATLVAPLPKAELRAAARPYEIEASTDAYLEAMGLPPKAPAEPTPKRRNGETMTTAPGISTTPPAAAGGPEVRYAFTVFVPTYNRGYCLTRALDSIAASSCRDLEIIVVDDGSTDDTRALVETWRATHDLPLRYLYQANAGKHAAHNKAIAQARGFMFLTLDSDDSLLPGALAAVQAHWAGIPEAERHRFAGIGGLLQEEDGSISGTAYPSEVVDSDYLEIDALGYIHGDKREALRTAVLREFPYPVFPGENHLRPSLILRRIGHRYRTRFVNVPLVLGRREADGISHNRKRYRVRNPQGLRLAFLEEINLHDAYTGAKQLHRYHVRYVRFSLNSGVGLVRQAKEVKHGWHWLAALPEGLGSWLGDRLITLFRRDG